MNWMTSAKKRIYKTKKQKDQQKRIAAKSRLIQGLRELEPPRANRRNGSHELSYDEKILQGGQSYPKAKPLTQNSIISPTVPIDDQSILYFEDGIEMWSDRKETKDEPVVELYDWKAELELSDDDQNLVVRKATSRTAEKHPSEIKIENQRVTSPITSLVANWEIFDGKINPSQSHIESLRKRKSEDISILTEAPEKKTKRIPSTNKEDGYFDIEDIDMSELL